VTTNNNNNNESRARWRAALSAGPEPFQREHEYADALLRLLIAHSRYGASNDANRLGLVQHVAILLVRAITERVERVRGKQAAKEFRKALARRGP
jgi:hypothetical protein